MVDTHYCGDIVWVLVDNLFFGGFFMLRVVVFWVLCWIFGFHFYFLDWLNLPGGIFLYPYQEYTHGLPMGTHQLTLANHCSRVVIFNENCTLLQEKRLY